MLCSNDKTKPLGEHLLRNRLIRALGFVLVCVPTLEWYALPGEAEERRTYLQAKVEQAVEEHTAKRAAAPAAVIEETASIAAAAAAVVCVGGPTKRAPS